MTTQSPRGSPPPERGRSASEARRVGVKADSRFDRTEEKTRRARRLRRDSTDVEARLWAKLRDSQINGYSFRRQHPAGPYVLDFYCPSLRLAVELDGGQHSYVTEVSRDRERDAWLAARGVTVLRFWNSDIIENMTGVLEKISLVASQLSQKQMTPTRRWRADLPLSGGGRPSSRQR